MVPESCNSLTIAQPVQSSFIDYGHLLQVGLSTNPSMYNVLASDSDPLADLSHILTASFSIPIGF
jgi:hypothetical protein